MNAMHISQLKSPIKPGYKEVFSGTVNLIGFGAMSVRNSDTPINKTVIGVHGFLENHCYFTEQYSDPSIELILQTCCHYHLPIMDPKLVRPDWEIPIKSTENTIAYDASVLTQGIQNLPTSDHIVVHGHSRGCAVILESARRRPDLFRGVSVILEAPVLPKGQLHPLFSNLVEAISFSMVPLTLSAGRYLAATPLVKMIVGALSERKQLLIESFLNTTKDSLTVVRNVEDIIAWMDFNDESIFDYLESATILIPKQDRVLDISSMCLSANKSHNNIKIVMTDATSHFISLDQPELIPNI